MPPKVKITEQEILEAALELTREKGWSSITARDIANRLHCSTQPLFRIYQNMNALKEKLYERVGEEYNSYMLAGLNNPDPFQGLGLAYIQFARKEKYLFQLLFMTDAFHVHHLSEIIKDKDNEEIVSMISKMSGLSKESAQQTYINVWLTTHGIAAMIATNSCDLSEDEIKSILESSCLGTIKYLKEKERYNESIK